MKRDLKINTISFSDLDNLKLLWWAKPIQYFILDQNNLLYKYIKHTFWPLFKSFTHYLLIIVLCSSQNYQSEKIQEYWLERCWGFKGVTAENDPHWSCSPSSACCFDPKRHGFSMCKLPPVHCSCFLSLFSTT